MGYRPAVAMACAPLLGIATVVFLIIAVDGEAINPQGRGGPLNTVGIGAYLFGVFGWLVSIPLGILMAFLEWFLRKRD